MGRKGPPALWGVIYPAPKGGGTSQGPPALLSWSTTLRKWVCVCVCVCVSLTKHFRVPRPGVLAGVRTWHCWASSVLLGLFGCWRGAHGILGNVLEHGVCALLRVNLVTAWSRVLQGLSHSPPRSTVWDLCDSFGFFLVFWELQVLTGPNPWGKAHCSLWAWNSF